MRWPDDTLRLLRDGYRFGERGFQRADADLFRTRLMARRVTVLRGLDAARFFYEDGRFDRSPGSVPRSAVHLLQDLLSSVGEPYVVVRLGYLRSGKPLPPAPRREPADVITIER